MQNKFKWEMMKGSYLYKFGPKLQILYNWMTQQAQKMQKLEKKVKVKLGGYIV